MNRLQQLYSEHQLRLYKYFYVRTMNRQSAEDLTHDVFYEASKTIHLYRGDASLTSWMYAIANNLLKKYYRSKKYDQSLHKKLVELQFLHMPSAEEIVVHRLQLQHLQNEMAKLEEQHQQVILLRLYSELSFKEIGEIVGCSENYARVQFYRIKRKLKKGDEMP